MEHLDAYLAYRAAANRWLKLMDLPPKVIFVDTIGNAYVIYDFWSHILRLKFLQRKRQTHAAPKRIQ
jgi:hypothetical protein